MCHPRSAKVARNPEEDRNAIRSMFGNRTRDNDTVKFFSKLDFFLAGSYNELEEQFRTTVEFLNLLTCKGGIASEGYTHGLKFLLKNQPIFLKVIKNWPVFCIEYVYMLDCIFQHFVTRLGRYYQNSNPIREVRAEFKYQQVRQFQTMMAGFEVSSIPNLCLPGTLKLSVTETCGGPGDPAAATGNRAPT
jgi:hypothetical protein